MIEKDLGPMVPLQEQQNWCWAATTAGVHNFVYSKTDPNDVKKCEVANRMLDLTDCCNLTNGQTPIECNVQSGLTLPLFEYDCHKTTFANKVDFDNIMAEIDNDLPLCVRVVWQQGFGEGHFAVIVGYIFDDEKRTISDVIIEDSAYQRSIQTYASFKEFYRTILMTPEGVEVQEGFWTHSYFIAPQSEPETDSEDSER